jgi:hypothetical protein
MSWKQLYLIVAFDEIFDVELEGCNWLVNERKVYKWSP